MISLALWAVAAVAGALIELGLANHSRYDATLDARTVDRAMRLTIALCLGVPLIAFVLPGWRSPTALVAVGGALALVGLVLRAWAIGTLGRRYTLTPQAQSDDHYICSTGPYRYLRHPGYLGLLVQFLGMGLMLSPAAVAGTLPMIAAVVLRIAGEEKILVREFADIYDAYRGAVRWKLVPCLF